MNWPSIKTNSELFKSAEVSDDSMATYSLMDQAKVHLVKSVCVCTRTIVYIMVDFPVDILKFIPN